MILGILHFLPAPIVCEVEIDPDTGVTEIVKFTAVDDFGNVINPMIVAGQGSWWTGSGYRPGSAGELCLR